MERGPLMTIRRTVYASAVEALDALIRSGETYERRYQNGELGDTADVAEGAGDYQHYLQLKEDVEQKLAAAG